VTSHIDRLSDATPEIGRLGFDRVVFFSDAVFAIAMTLLVVDLRLPDLVAATPGVDTAGALWEARWDIFAFVLSFLVIGSFWLAHWRRYHHIQRVDGRHAAINLLFLGSIAFLPFPTSVLSTSDVDPGGAAAFYAISVSVAGLLSLLAVSDAWRRDLYAPAVTRAEVRAWFVSGCVVPGVMLASLLALPFVGPTVVGVAWVVAAVLAGYVPRRLA
jgi:uncharacterized membrane protein